ncbi:fringe glycosyltransferase [Condylostylus longicornis]|uniref:fringe glycosyltransferase n=1 Tax=Condylostylus longicornis TaxID=2530218 RepID=UPI00244E42F1|nr:fringe glycosyltransferase [Condylostylus longicornis]
MSINLSLPINRFKRILQAMTLLVIIIYMTLVIYQTTYGYPPNTISQGIQTQNLDDKKINYQIIKNHNYYNQHQYQQNNNDNDNINNINNNNQNNNYNKQPTTVIIRKDILSFNFSDIPISEKSTLEDEIDKIRDSYNKINNLKLLYNKYNLNNNNINNGIGGSDDNNNSNDIDNINNLIIDSATLNNLINQQYGSVVTGTPKPSITQLDDIFISVKTTKNYHDNRLALIIKTWFQLAKDQTWFFTDTEDKYYQEKTKGHLINTNCSMGHFRKALCCKMSAELDVFLESGKKWFCHFDDDNYVNIPRLVRLLDEYNPAVDWYLGKPSISSPLEIHLDSKNSSIPTNKKITFWFATGGAGFCLSRALTLKMLPIAGGGKFISIGDKIRFPDDVTMGFIIEHLLKVPLTVVDNFHSHLEPMEFIRPETFHDQVSFSYARMKNEWNVVKIDGFDQKTDPKRFYSLHCHLFPYFSFCPR